MGRAEIKEIFNQCQTGLQGHGKLAKSLAKVYEKTEFDSFWTDFNQCLKYAMIVFKREPAVERLIDFVAKFVTSLSSKSEEDKEVREEEEEDAVEDNQLLQKMFDFLLASHSANDRGVRFRCCQLINKLLVNLGDGAQIDDDLYDRLYECMLERLKDRCPVVRYHAVLAMARLQDPGDENCPVIKAYLFLLNCDPNPDVRRAVLQTIAPSTKTLASIVGRTRDKKDTVRKTAYIVISEKIHIKALSIALRLQILNEGLNDRAEIVKQACSGKLLKAWLHTLDGKILGMLHSLDVEDATATCSKVLETLYNAATPQAIVEGFNLLDENLLIPEADLTSESALYWQSLCKFLQSLGPEGEEYKDKVLPNCVTFCAFVQRYVDELKKVDDPEIQLTREFIIEQLLLLASYMDTADSASRKAVEKLLHNMLMAECVSHRLIKSVITQLCALKGIGEAIMPYIAETVAEIREPITIVERDIEAEQKRQTNLKIAGIRVQLNQLREDLDGAVRGEDFAKAAEIKAQVAELDAEKARLLETNEPAREEVRTERTDPETLLKCMTIVSEVLQVAKLNKVSPTLQMMIESQIVPGIQNENAEVRNMAIQALGLCCYMSKDLLHTYIPLFMQASQIDVELVRVTALKILFDVLLIFGLEEITSSDTSSGSSDSTDGEPTEPVAAVHNTASKMVAIFSSFLDGESSELRTCAAEGFSKLLLSRRVVSSKILSHLILLWYNPLSEDDTHLRGCLGTFFPIYALTSRSNQEVVEGAFLPTLRTLLNAPLNSPLAEVNVSNVAELLVQLTNTRLLTSNMAAAETNKDNPGHDNLLEAVCNEILTDPTSPNVRLWVRILNQMEPSPDNEVLLKDLRVLCHKMVNLVKDKTILKSVQRFQETISQMASQFVSADDDLTDVQITAPPVVPAEEVEPEPATPKRKRVRGLYTQASNLTMELDVDSDLDITADTTQDIDATCLMSRASETSVMRTHKSSINELAAEDILRETDERKKQSSMNRKAENADVNKTPAPVAKEPVSKEPVVQEPAIQEPVVQEAAPDEIEDVFPEPSESEENSPQSRSSRKRLTNKRTASDSPEKTPRVPLKRPRSEEMFKSNKQKGKASEKRSNSLSPAGSLRKRSRSSSQSMSPVKSPRGRAKSKSPGKTGSSQSPQKRPAARSAPLSQSQSKKGKEGQTRPGSKSPVKKKTATSTTVERNAASSKNKSSKSPERKSSSKSPVKKPAQNTKVPVSNEMKETTTNRTVRTAASKPPDKRPLGPTSSKHPSRLPETKKLPSSTAQRNAYSKTVPKPTTVTKPTNDKNVRKTAPIAASANPPSKLPVGASRPTTRSPRIAAIKEKEKPSSSHVSTLKAKTAASNEKSPRLILEKISHKPAANGKSVLETPESQRTTRSTISSRLSLNETPQSTRSTRSTRGTPTSSASGDSVTKGRAVLRQSASVLVAETPSPASSRRGRVLTPSSMTRSNSKGMPAVKGTPEVTQTRGSKRKSDVISSVSSVESTNSQTSVSDSEDEEEMLLRRKARPSRRSAQPVNSTPAAGQSPAQSRQTRRSNAGGDNPKAQPQRSSDRSGSRETVTKTTTSARNIRGQLTSSPESTSKPSPRVTRSTPRSAATTKSVKGTPLRAESDTDSVFSPPSSVRSTRSSRLTPRSSQPSLRSSQSSTASLTTAAAKNAGQVTKTTTQVRQPQTRGSKVSEPARSLRTKSLRK